MNKYIITFIIFSASLIHAQDEYTISQIKEAYRSNNYLKAIALSDKFISANPDLSNDLQIDIQEIRAVSYYSIGERDSSKNSFFKILELDRNYSPNPSKISPKIINFFSGIRSDFERVINIRDERIDSLLALNETENPLITAKDQFANTVLRSIILPGWGHFYAGKTTLGIGVGLLSTALIGSSIYFIIHTDNLKKDYASESNRLMISEKYDKYNSAFKIRNSLLISYAAVWLFSQLDILFFSRDDLITIQPQISSNSANAGSNFYLNLNLPLN